jgi:hypothetical protein
LQEQEVKARSEAGMRKMQKRTAKPEFAVGESAQRRQNAQEAKACSEAGIHKRLKRAVKPESARDEYSQEAKA